MATKRIAKEMALVFCAGDTAAVVKKKVSDAITILDKGGYEVCGLKLAFYDTGRKAVPAPAPPRTRRPRQPRVPASSGLEATMPGSEVGG